MVTLKMSRISEVLSALPALLALVLVLGAAEAGAQIKPGQFKNPADWKWRLDAPATLVSTLAVPDDGSWLFVGMPPGWHVTTGPAVLLFPAAPVEAAGNFSLEARIFLFPGESQEEYGLFLGGQDIDGEKPAEYLAFVIRRDGQAAILARGASGTKPLAAWRAHEKIVAHRGGENPVENVLRVDVTPASATFSVNGAQVATIPRQEAHTDGRIGFRLGKALNLHIASLDVTSHLAPVPAPTATPVP